MIRTILQTALALPPNDLELTEQPIRRRLISAIRRKPGIHASQLAREIHEPWGTVQYHLSLLRSADMVNAIESGRERRFFPPDVDPTKARLLSMLHQGRRPDITRFIHDHPGARQVEICDAVGVSRKTFRSSVRPLVDEGLIEEQRGLHANRYFPHDGLTGALESLEDPAGIA